ncbi:MAG: hypothetical protein ABSA75_15680 [Candidatus Bathyarchaeia archaeon]|jgi:hypothetical protein
MKGKIWKIVALLSIVIFILSMVASAYAASLTTTITTGGVGAEGVVYDPAMHEIFVDNYYSGNILAISDINNQQVADIIALTQYAGPPFNLAYDSAKGEIWVADGTGAYAISDANNQVVANVTNIISSWGSLVQIACDPKTGEVFVNYNTFTGLGSPYMQVISDSSNTIIANVTQAGALFASGAFVDDSAKSEIFAVGTSDIYVISAKTNEVTNTIPVSNQPSYLAYDSALGEIFACEPGTIQVISDSKNQVSKTFSLPTSVAAGPMAYNPNKGEIYIDDGTSVAIISDQKYNVIGTVNTNGTGTASGGIAFDSGTNTLYAINYGGSDETGAFGSLAVISDPSSGTPTSSPTSTATSSTGTSASASPTSTPKVPEFSSPALALIAAALAAATLCTVAFARKKQRSDTYK